VSQLPPEQRGNPARSSSEWDAILSGRGAADVAPPAPPAPAPPAPVPAAQAAPPTPTRGPNAESAQDPAPQPRTRREAREAEQRRAALLAQQEQQQAATEPGVEQGAPKWPVAAQPYPSTPSYTSPQPVAAASAVPTQPAVHHAASHRLDPSSPALGESRHDAEQQWPDTRLATEPTREDTTSLLPWQEDPDDPWQDDLHDTSHARLSRAERRALKHGYHDDEDRPKRKGPWGCLVGLLVVAALGAGAFFFLQAPVTALIERFQPAADYSGSGTGEVVFMINEGDGGDTIAANLEAEGVVASAEAFTEEVTSRGSTVTFYPGAYQLAKEMSAKAALNALLDPANKLENTFVIQEGLWARDALAAASTATGIPVADLEAAAADPQALGLPAEATSVEGFLFPATYTFPPDVTAQQVVQTLVDRSIQALDEAGVPPEQRWQTVVIASLIEREAGSEEDAYKVSRVIRNRLDPAQFESGLLQFDSTVHYGIGDDSTVETSDAERADASNPYNTYVHPGLPPGPIGNPGDVAIDAALHPADGPWLYFVTVNLETGETVFSATLEEHEAAVEQFNQYLQEHGG
jgi:UPF0755 protein